MRITAGGVGKPEMARIRVRVEGVVQGVGFRPFVYGVASRLGLAGFVGNDGRGVVIEAEGEAAALDCLVDALSTQAPPLARVERVTVEPAAVTGLAGFTISASDSSGSRTVLVAPDTATCVDCLTEMADPGDRRHAYAFTNCTNCGPRYTIVRELPYDRPGTTMAAFVLCEPCEREYRDPLDRRFHAQPVCCPDCGPRLRLVSADSALMAGDPVSGAAGLLAEGAIVAIKGLGGYHLAVAASNEEAVSNLRSRKHREERPLALMVPDIEAARRLCVIDDVEEALLLDIARPIVLLERRSDAGIAASVAPGQRGLGVMLPYSPLHYLLATAHPDPLVMTSGNLSSEPIAYRDDDALNRLAGIADAFLIHDRAIHTRVDDSVLRASRGGPLPIRRSRGFAPAPLTLPWEFPRHVLACGPELKNTFCLARGRHAFVSHHIGDLENHETLQSFTEGIEHFRRLFSVAPEVVVHDLHPEYLSTKYALECDAELLGVQHHHAHIASCLADNEVADPVIGVAFDGLGMGTDGTLWGGEFLVADLAGFTRAAHLAPVAMPGAARAVREPWRMAAAYLDAVFGLQWPDAPTLKAFRARHETRLDQVLSMARAGLNSPLTSSAGRLFDAVAALAGVRDTVSYEGQAAIEFEQLADRSEPGRYGARIESSSGLVHGSDLVAAALADLDAGVAVPVVAARFHNGLAAVVVEVCERLRRDTGLAAVALSGGVFQNVLLVERCVAGLEAAGFRVLTHRRVPPNDGGISLGQAAVCGARDRLSC
ncbi:carbamoyltransferase HypF [Catenulispora rubra]|uniref:carbamoyltransferase HypF n=1 Tax=Catenulispora rubra TaxID=280293 RepID=UPI001E40054A|nr:carbamoyltransferase HypF [Catenulispora rubra]